MLFDEILKNKDKIRFHTPGHSRPDNRLLNCDVTELSYSDNLLSPVGEIKELEKFLASAYSAEAAFLSTQGATANIFQAVYARKDDGAFLIVGNAHRSVYNAMRLFSCSAYHVDSLYFPLPGDVKTVVLTCPDYFGEIFDLPKIYKSLQERNVCLIVDAAHGAHFAFSSKLPVSASEHSDLAILSLHKTMPVITGGSVLTAKSAYVERCLFSRNLIHTTSPNYMTMCSIENAVRDYKKRGEEIYDKILSEVSELERNLKPPFLYIKTDDFSRLVISSPYDGRDVSAALFDRGFVCETAFENKVVFIVTKDNFNFLPILTRCINELPKFPEYKSPNLPFKAHKTPIKLNFSGTWESVNLNDAVGRRLYGEAGFYPPGVPLLYSGDEITDDTIRFFTIYGDRVFGLENGRARVLK